MSGLHVHGNAADIMIDLGKLKYKPGLRKTVKLLLLFFGCLAVIYLVIPLPSPIFREDYSTAILDRKGRILRAFLNQEEQWQFSPDENAVISPKLETAVLLFEDRWFYWHPGVNPFALFRALKQNIRGGETVSGASTITMQVARLMAPKSRTYLHKILEMTQALKIEIHYSKAGILRLYLDHAPYGGNVIGCRAAALRYFRKTPQELTWSEAATLAVLPNAPGLISPQSDPGRLKVKRDRLLLRLHNAGEIDEETFQLACLEEVPRQSYAIPVTAPHAAQWLKKSHRSGLVRTTIDKSLQTEIEQMMKSHGRQLQNFGIENCAALIVETQTGKVRAYCGSQDFEDRLHNGQNDGVQALRSSGSILKPFLYALSIDEGLILSQTLIQDVPTYFGSFSPANADESYSGIVCAKDALIRSLNVPAVRLLNKFGLHGFYYFLKEAGLTGLFRQADDYGLPLILGGAEVSLWETAGLFRGLACGGQFRPITLIEDDAAGLASPKFLISPGSAFLTLEMLQDVRRPGSEYYWQKYRDSWPFAWKTGTSYGQRDAWAVGVSPQWTVAVWAGNFEGQGNANLSGNASAGLLLFDIFNFLPKDAAKRWFIKKPDDFTPRQICRATGFAAGPDCPDPVWAETPAVMKPLAVCPFHKRLYVTVDEKEQVCSLCWDKTEYKSVIRLIFPPDVSQFMRQSGQITDVLPPHRNSCSGLSMSRPLRIVYPQQDASLWIPRDFDGVLQKINLRVAHQKKNQTIYWYLDSVFKGTSSEKHELAVDLSKGWHDLEVMDQDGHQDRIRFYANLKQR